MIDCNYKKIYQTALLILVFPFILTNICCATSNDLLKAKGDISSMNSQLKLEIELDKQAYKINEPIIIKCKISNLSENIVNLHPILLMSLGVYLKHKDSTESSSLEPTILPFELIKKEDITKLKPREIYSFERIISKEMHYIMPSKIGYYELYVIYRNMTNELGGIKLWFGEIESNIVKFEIK